MKITMAKFSIEKNSSRINELRQEVESKKEMAENLKATKEELVAARSEIEGSEVSDEAKEAVAQSLELRREQISEQAQEVGDEIGNSLSELEEMMQEVQTVEESNKVQQKNIENKMAILEKFGYGGLLENGLDILQNESEQIEELKNAIIEARKSAEEAVHMAGQI